MKTRKQQIWKSISLLAFSFAASLFLFTNCDSDEDVYIKPQVTISEDGVISENNEISFDKEASSKTIEINSNRDWKVTKDTDADWIDITPISGTSEQTTKINIAVKSNEGVARKEFITIEASTARVTLRINQASVEGIEFKNSTIEEIRTLYASSGKDEWTIKEPLQLKAVITSDREGGNSNSLKNGFMQDEAGHGIGFRTTADHKFNMGDEVNIDLEGAIVSQYAGALQLAFSTANGIVQNTDVVVIPKELTIEEILSGGYDATLVKIKDVQFNPYKNLKYYEGEENAVNRTLENINNAKIIARTAKYAKFKDKVIPKGKGSVVGIMSVFNGTWQLAIRNLGDVSGMSDDESTRFIAEGGGTVIPGDNDGTKEHPYTVAEAIANQGKGTGVWVKAFIVGSSNSDANFVPQFTKDNPSGTNVVIADSKNETVASKVVPVQLAWDGDARAALNLESKPGMYKAEVLLKGDFVKYFGVPGLKEVREYEVVTPGEGG